MDDTRALVDHLRSQVNQVRLNLITHLIVPLNKHKQELEQAQLPHKRKFIADEKEALETWFENLFQHL